MNAFTYQTPLGDITIYERNGYITELGFGLPKTEDINFAETPVLKQAAAQLRQYFAKERKTFDLPLAPQGTPFQRAVWAALLNIPYGQTRTYKDIAKAAGCPKGARAVGMACNKNPIGIIIPCHRVIGANGSLTGYAGGLELKQKLLLLEAAKGV